MYENYKDARRYAKAMFEILQKLEVEISLHECQHALALGGGYRDWRHLHQTLVNGKARFAPPPGFAHRVLLAVPRMALDPTARWIEAQIARQRQRRQGRNQIGREHSDRYILSYEYVRSIPATHLLYAPQLQTGSGSGLRLRQNIIRALSYDLHEVHLDLPTFTLSFIGELDDLFGDLVDHPHFDRELQALAGMGILEWREDDALLILHPPLLHRVRDRIARHRMLAAGDYIASSNRAVAM